MKRCNYYIAYGSNLSLYEMSRRCPTAKLIGLGHLEDWELAFRYYLDIQPCKGAKVPIALYEIHKEDKWALNQYENFPTLYHLEFVDVKVDGKTYKGFVYVMNQDCYPYALPSIGYLERVAYAYKELGFDTDYLINAVKVV